MANERTGKSISAATLVAAKEVKTPMTFFAWVGGGILATIPILYGIADDPVSWGTTIIISTLALMLGVVCVCVLQWGKARLVADPNAFNNASDTTADDSGT